ncbi:MAG: protein kinase, partial [Myxococcales bacterium]|nr:protein kinase [Myxococcales bacterium]
EPTGRRPGVPTPAVSGPEKPPAARSPGGSPAAPAKPSPPQLPVEAFKQPPAASSPEPPREAAPPAPGPLADADATVTPSFTTMLGNGPPGPNPAGGLAPGSTFGVYVVGPCIGEGGMARIYRAEHGGLRRHVALKVLTDGFAQSPEGRERFVREARIAAAIKHPNVVNIFDVGVQDGVPYLVMELLEGRDLEKLLEPRKPLETALIIDVMVPVIAGLIAVHDAGIVHRDLKPGNIFLAQGRYNEIEPKLLDFGISKAAGLDQLKLTVHRTFIGTPFYMSPEGLRGGEMTPLSDQYSLGIVMYECATGVPPFTAMNFAELSNCISSGKYEPVSARNPDISKRLARIIERAMSLDPAERFRDLREMGRELLTLAGQRTRITWGLSFGEAHLTLPSAKPGLAEGVSSPPPAGPSRSRAAGLARRLGVIAALFLGGVALLRWISPAHRGEVSGHPVAPTSTSAGLTATETRSPPGGARLAEKETPPAASPDRATMAPAAEESTSDVGAAPAKRPGGRDLRAARAGADPAALAPRPLRANAPAGRRPAKPAAEADPEWALPSGGGSSSAPRAGDASSGITANGAPIFD